MHLLLNKQFVDFFRETADLVSNKRGFWRLKKQVKGNHENYSESFNTMEVFSECFPWINTNKIRLQYSEELHSHYLQFYDPAKDHDFYKWKNTILYNFNEANIHDSNFTDYVEINFNYLYKNSLKKESEHKVMTVDSNYTLIFLHYHPSLDITTIEIQFAIRGEFFYRLPWGTNYPTFSLTESEVFNNRRILAESLHQLTHNYQFKIFNSYLEATLSGWQIKDDGFY